MMNSLERSYADSDAMLKSVRSSALMVKQPDLSGAIADMGPAAGLNVFRDDTATRRRYTQFRGWVYAAINALASEAAGQPFHVGNLLGALPNPNEEERRFRVKNRLARTKAEGQELEVLLDHELIDAIENPNPIQHRWQFVYSFVANLMLTGWSYVIGGENAEGRLEFYSIPTSWVRPDHKEGPFSRFKIVNPKNPSASQNDDDWFTREQVAFAYLPNPSDPLAAMAPASAQSMAISIDDNIQASQNQFFDNGIFPSVVITIGKDPHPDVPAGIRPRLTANQRRQVTGAIRKVSAGVANYGNPAIIDGLIEKIERLSATQNEMGWDKSEEKIITRILSAFGVHRFILGDTINVGGYAQAYKIEERFCKRVNTVLDMLGNIMTTFAGPMVSEQSRTLVWWDPCEPHDPDQLRRWWETGVKSGHVKRNEYRAKLGLPPLEDEEERNALLESVGGMTGAINLFNALGQGNLTSDQVAKLLTLFFQIPLEEALDIVGNPEQQAAVNEAVDALGEAVEELRKPVSVEIKGAELAERLAATLVAASRSEDDNLTEVHKTLGELQTGLSIEQANREAGQRVISAETSAQIAKLPALVKDAFAKLSNTVASHQREGQLANGVKSAITSASDSLNESLKTIQDAVKQPINVQVTNEVQPTPVSITNEVATPSVHNEILPTPVEIKNEVTNNVEPTPVEIRNDFNPEVKVEPPNVTVEATVDPPDIKVEPQIVVQPAEVDVRLKDEPARSAIVRHPDGTVSQVQINRGES